MYTTQSIIKKFNSIHCDKYDYSKVSYIKSTEKVKIICPEHGEFMQTPQAHLKGQGCPKCGKKLKSINKKYNTEQFITLSLLKHGNKYNYNKTIYINNKEKVCIVCPIHGEFFMEPNAHIQGRGCPKCGNLNKGRKSNVFKNSVISYIKKQNNDFILNFNIEGEIIDLFIPTKKIAFMFIDFKTYSEESNKNKKLLLNKTEICEKKDIQLIHIFEDEWRNKKEICKSRINNILKISKRIYARKCNIINIDKKDAKVFFNENHIQGNVNSTYIFGLEYNGEIVSMMSFGGLRKNMGRKHNENDYELLRFCNKIGVAVIGGASRLFKYFVSLVNPYKVISYADRRWSMGNLYEQLYFTFSHTSEPNYFYLIDGIRKNRFGYRKDILISKFGCNYYETEHEFCLKNKWFRIYDCGTKVYTWVKK